jgi:hypothetical protein
MIAEKLAITIRSQSQNLNEIPARVGHEDEIFLGQAPREEVDDKVSNNPIRSKLRFESQICASTSKLSKFIRQEA